MEGGSVRQKDKNRLLISERTHQGREGESSSWRGKKGEKGGIAVKGKEVGKS